MSVISPGSVDLSGFIDVHVHSAPDVRPRSLDDVEVARGAAAAGMAGVLIKSHVTITADRAAIAERVVPGVRVFGGVVLNHAVGGLNPAAVEAAIELGAREVWLPTFSARGAAGAPGGISVVGADGGLVPAVLEVLKLVADADVILGTGHLSVPEIALVVREARRLGVRKVLVTHPEASLVAMPVNVQRELAGEGAWFERCYVGTLGPSAALTVADIARQIRAVGPASTVISTDLGQAGNPLPWDGFRAYAASLLVSGLTPDEVRVMAAENPARLLGL